MICKPPPLPLEQCLRFLVLQSWDDYMMATAHHAQSRQLSNDICQFVIEKTLKHCRNCVTMYNLDNFSTVPTGRA